MPPTNSSHEQYYYKLWKKKFSLLDESRQMFPAMTRRNTTFPML